MGLPSTEELSAAPLSIVVFGPGFGESIVLRAAANGDVAWAVVDSARRERRGKSVNPAADLLAAQGASLRLVLLTHPHEDHASGMASLVEAAGVDATIACVEPLMSSPSPFAPASDPDDTRAVRQSQARLAHVAIQAAWSSGRRRWPVVNDTTFDLNGWTLTALHPDPETVRDALDRWKAGQRFNPNDLSAALLIQREGVALVLGADCEEVAWTAVQTRIAPADLRAARPVKVPHHGSREALQPVLIDHTQRDEGRPQIVTPFPKSGRLPRFDNDQGVERLLSAAGLLQLTAMPVELVPTRERVALAEVRAAMDAEIFEDDDALEIRPDAPEGSAAFAAETRDPHETWVLLGVSYDGSINIVRGAHAAQIVED